MLTRRAGCASTRGLGRVQPCAARRGGPRCVAVGGNEVTTDDTVTDDVTTDSGLTEDTGEAIEASIAWTVQLDRNYRAGDIVSFDLTGVPASSLLSGATLSEQGIDVAAARACRERRPVRLKRVQLPPRDDNLANQPGWST